MWSKNCLAVFTPLIYTLAIVYPAASAVIRIEPDDFTSYTALTNVVPDVTLSIDSRPELTVISLNQFGIPSTGNQFFGIIGSGGTQGLFFSNAQLRADFDKLANSVSIDFIGISSGETIGKLLAFDSEGDLLDSFFTDPLKPRQIQEGSVTSNGFDIAYVIASITENSPGIYLDNFAVNIASVPEPSFTLGLLFISTLGVNSILKHKLKQK